MTIAGMRRILAVLCALSALLYAAGCGVDLRSDVYKDKDNDVGGGVSNQPPVAFATTDQTTVNVGTPFTLDGSLSMDPNYDLIFYSWSIQSAPFNSSAVLASDTSPIASFAADVEGIYTFQLTVSDGLATDSTWISVTAGFPNTAPVADAGGNQSVVTGNTVHLSGSGSFDSDGDLLTYLWTLSAPPNSSAVLSSTSAIDSSFVADLLGDYTVTLEVNDGLFTDTAIITVTAGQNTAPAANAGGDQVVPAGSTVHLDGTASSDPTNDPLTYAWTIASAPLNSSASLAGADTMIPTFFADLTGTYTINLVVSDGTLTSLPDSVTVTALTNTGGPTAEAGVDQTVTSGDLVTLNGSGSTDPDSNPLTYTWTITAPNSNTTTLTGLSPTFTVSQVGYYLVSLTVSDGFTSSAADTLMVTVLLNNAPVAVVAADPGLTNVPADTTVRLNGSGSYDIDADTLTYYWTLNRPYNSTASLTAPDLEAPEFTVDFGGIYEITLTVTDNHGATNTSAVTLKTDIPSAQAGLDGAGNAGIAVHLNGTGSYDPDGAALTYNWFVVSCPTCSTIVDNIPVITNPTTMEPTFTPNIAGQYVIGLAVNDGSGDSKPDNVVINVTGGTLYYRDSDGDGCGNLSDSVNASTKPYGYVLDSATCNYSTDCNDNSAQVRPGIPEFCADTLDNDCSGAVNEGCM